MKRFLNIIPIFFLVLGCASSELQLNLDIYREDPFKSAPISPEQMARIENGIDGLERESAALAQNRKTIGDNLINTYNEIFYVVAKAKFPDYSRAQLDSDTSGFGDQLADYKDLIDKKLSEIRSSAQNARAALSRYADIVSEHKTADTGEGNTEEATVLKLDILRLVNQLENAVTDLGSPLNTPFENSLLQNWGTVQQMASLKNLEPIFTKKLPMPDLSALRATAEKYSKDIDELNSSGYKISDQTIAALHDGIKHLQTPTPNAFLTSVEAIARATTTLSPAIGLGDRGATELSRLVQATSLLNSQIARLQDPADPVWRILSDPKNEENWNLKFSETYFKAQGNASVVVVRDSPIDYRQQKGSNNPTALIKNQLQISRAIGNAAISIAAATTGVPIKMPLPDKTGTVEAEPEASAESDALARRKAMAEEQLRLRTQALRNLRNNLISMREEFRLKNSSKTLKDYPELRSRFENILKAHQPFFLPQENTP